MDEEPTMSITDGIERYILRPKQVLIAEDEPDCADALKTMLSHHYVCEFTEVTDGSEAVSAVNHQDFDIAFVDILLNGRSGLDVLSHIKSTKPKLPVVLMSGYFDSTILNAAATTGTVTFLRKPCDLNLSKLAGVFEMFNIRAQATSPPTIAWSTLC